MEKLPRQEAQKVDPEEETQRQGKEPERRPPAMSKEDAANLESFRKQVLSKGCPGAFPIPIAVSVVGYEDINGGQDVLLHYNHIKDLTWTNEGGAWDGISNFVAPCPGLYYFAMTFVKDPTYNNGTTDDVSVWITKNGKYIVYAWAGENDCTHSVKTQTDRGTGATHVILRLKIGDIIQTHVGSDSGRPWYIRNFNFSGHRIGP